MTIIFHVLPVILSLKMVIRASLKLPMLRSISQFRPARRKSPMPLLLIVERLELRKQTAEEFKALSGAARQAGVHDKMFGVFHDAGYKGMYGGLGRDEIKKHKKIPEKENLMDRMDTTELAANQFRMTQTRDKLARDRVRDQQSAIRTHENVGKEVREAIKRIGGTLTGTAASC